MVHYITGGARSGKSSFAHQEALKLSTNPIYLATARNWDDNFNERIKRHQSERDDNWTNIEEELSPYKHKELLEKRVCIIDCVTLWLTNFFVDYKYDIEKSLAQFKQEIDLLCSIDAHFLIISNEIGMGVHSSHEQGRLFTDLQGWANQYIAQKADTATFMVSGLPLKLK